MPNKKISVGKVDDCSVPLMRKPTIVNVRWWDGYLEVFECLQVRQGGHILWMRLTNLQNRTIPLTGNVRWFSTDPESHASQEAM